MKILGMFENFRERFFFYSIKFYKKNSITSQVFQLHSFLSHCVIIMLSNGQRIEKEMTLQTLEKLSVLKSIFVLEFFLRKAQKPSVRAKKIFFGNICG